MIRASPSFLNERRTVCVSGVHSHALSVDCSLCAGPVGVVRCEERSKVKDASSVRTQGPHWRLSA